MGVDDGRPPEPANRVEHGYAPSWDGLGIPFILALPEHTPAPVVLLAWGNGGGGMPAVQAEVRHRRLVMQRLLERGYGSAWAGYRTEVESGYTTRFVRGVRSGGELFSRSPLDHEDVLAAVAHIAAHPAVDPARIAMIGVSHAGELALKVLAEPRHGLAAVVAAEPAAHEFLAFRRAAGEDVEQLEVDDVERTLARCDLEQARDRAARIDRPVLVLGRERDPLQPIFGACYRLLADCGAAVRWASWDHDEHGYVLPRHDPAEGYVDLAGSEDAIGEAIAFLDDVLSSSA